MKCPAEFKKNCRNFEVQCHQCRATTKSKKLYYVPLIKNQALTYKKLNNLLKNRCSNNPNYSKAGRKIEKSVIKNLGGKLTTNSGAMFSDGDGYLDIKDTRYYIEHKTRFNGRNTTGLTKAELRKAQAQNQALFVVTDQQTNQTIVSMELTTFKDLLAWVQDSS